MRSTRLMAAVFVLSSTLLFVACGGSDSDGAAGATETEDSGAGDGGALFDGMPVVEFYGANCAACHGGGREGISGLGLPLLPDQLAEDDDFYRDVIANGRPGAVMPAWRSRGVSDEEIDALIAFLRTEP